MLVSGKRAFQAQGTVNAKALRWEWRRHITGTAMGRLDGEGVGVSDEIPPPEAGRAKPGGTLGAVVSTSASVTSERGGS